MTPEERITLDEAVAILEITDLDAVTEDQLQKIRRKAQARWHPDKILHTNPSEETLERYQRNFRLVEQAIALVRAYLQGDVHGDAYADSYEEERARSYEEPQDVIRRNAAQMQAELREVWERVKQTAYKMHEEVVTVAHGLRFADMLRADLADRLPLLCMISFVFFFFTATVAMMAGALLFGMAKMGPDVPLTLGGLAIIVQLLACFLIFLPMSRFWLPEPIANAALFAVNLGLGIQAFIVRREWHEKHSWIGIPLGLLSLIALGLFWVVIAPLYLLAAALLGDRGFKDTTASTRFYAGLADWYIETLMIKDPAQMTDDELFDLSGIWGQLKDAPMGKAA